MKTLKDIIIDSKLRKGPSHGTTKKGAYWTYASNEYFTTLRRSGGDGIGQSSPDVTYYLELRHFRDGHVQAAICRKAWHQNDGTNCDWSDASAILGCTTIEDLIISLKGIEYNEQPIYGDSWKDNVLADFTKIGLPLSAPSPDDVTVQ